jgi:hypothetical protein
MNFTDLRKLYHENLCKEVIRYKKSNGQIYMNFSDNSSKSSVNIGKGIVKRFNIEISEEDIPGQSKGSAFELITLHYIKSAFDLLQHLHPGSWEYSIQEEISDFVQYSHLAELENFISDNKSLAAMLGQDYIIKSDIIISRNLISDDEINKKQNLIDSTTYANLNLVREVNNPKNQKILHASISCKWTLRSDRSQNTRSEALNLIRNRKGRLPHILAVTAEPMPTRIASLALGTGDLDCVYHFALNELIETIRDLNYDDQCDMLNTLINGKRLRDISDLVFDLLI